MKVCPFPSWNGWQEKEKKKEIKKKSKHFFFSVTAPVGATRLFSAPHKLLCAAVSKAVTDLAQA